MHIRTATSPFALVCRAILVAVLIAGSLLIGYTTPVETVFARDGAATEAAAPAYDNGPTGYFPDMFAIVEDAGEPAEAAPTF